MLERLDAFSFAWIPSLQFVWATRRLALFFFFHTCLSDSSLVLASPHSETRRLLYLGYASHCEPLVGFSVVVCDSLLGINMFLFYKLERLVACSCISIFSDSSLIVCHNILDVSVVICDSSLGIIPLQRHMCFRTCWNDSSLILAFPYIQRLVACCCRCVTQ